PVELDVDRMRIGQPDVESLRALFTELEFTSLLKELLPVVEVSETRYGEATAAEVEAVLRSVSEEAPLALALELATEQESAPAEDDEEGDNGPTLPLSDSNLQVPDSRSIAISAAPGTALTIGKNTEARSQLTSALADEKLPKSIHDLKTALHALESEDISLRGVEHDSALYSYLLDPTYTSHRLPDVALRRFNLKMSGTLAESADITGRLATALRREVEDQPLLHLYNEIDLPLVSVLHRMEHAGVSIDQQALSAMSSRLHHEEQAKAKEIYDHAGCEFNINSPKQLGDVLFNKLNLPKPVKSGKGKMLSTAVDVLEGLAATHEVPRLVLEYRQLSKLKSTYVDALPSLLSRTTGRLHTTFAQTGTATGRLSSSN